LVRWFCVLGVALLAGSLVGARFIFSGNGSGTESKEASGPVPVVAMGYVDTLRGVLNLAPPFAGRVVKSCEEGAAIEEGATLIELDSESAQDQLRAAEADLQASELAAKIAKDMADQYGFQIGQQEEAVNAARSKQMGASERYKRAKELLAANQIKEADANVARADLEAQEAGVKAEQRKLEGMKRIDPQLAVQRAEKDFDAKRAIRDRARKFVDDHILKAPVKGTVLRAMVNKGDMYLPDMRTPAVFFCPSDARIIRAEVDQEFASRVKTGQRVCITDDSNSQGRWTGVVGRVGDWFTQRRVVLPEPVTLHDVRTLECIIEKIEPVADTPAADRKDFPLRINQRMRVTIHPEGSSDDECK
jgi:multidrug resistance efflux pump